jgi:hypothetical protein
MKEQNAALWSAAFKSLQHPQIKGVEEIGPPWRNSNPLKTSTKLIVRVID